MESDTQQAEEKKRGRLLFATLFYCVIPISLLIAVSVAWSNWGRYPWEHFDSANEAGTFGDSFGYINSLFGGLAFAGVIYAIVLQTRELGLQRQELEATQEELKRSADAQEQTHQTLLITAYLNAHQSLYKIDAGRSKDQAILRLGELEALANQLQKGVTLVSFPSLDQSIRTVAIGLLRGVRSDAAKFAEENNVAGFCSCILEPVERLNSLSYRATDWFLSTNLREAAKTLQGATQLPQDESGQPILRDNSSTVAQISAESGISLISSVQLKEEKSTK